MKKSIKATVAILGIFLASTLFGSAQDMTKISKRKSLTFDKETEPVQVLIPISKEYNYLSIELQLNLFIGSAKCEIFDSKGKVQGQFTIEAEDRVKQGVKTTKTNAATGTLEKSFRNPINGDWKIKITPNEAIIGNTEIIYTQSYNPRYDLMEIEEIDKANKIDVIKEK